MTPEHGATPQIRTARTLAAILAAWVPAVTAVVTWMVWRDRFPAALPVHWGPSGRPDAFAGASVVLTWEVALTGACAFAASLVVAPGPADRLPWAVRRAVLGCLAATAGCLVAGWTVEVATFVGAGREAEVPLDWPAGAAAVGMVWGGVPMLLLGRREVDIAPEPAPDGLPVREGEHVMWAVHLRPRWVTAVLAVALVWQLAVVATQGPAQWPVAVVLALVLLVVADVRVTVDHRGVRVLAGLLRLPLKRIRLADVVRAGVEPVNPLRWGGWGYRVIPGRSALVLRMRTSPGLVVQLRDGRRFAVTVPDPETPAALLTTLCRTHKDGPSGMDE